MTYAATNRQALLDAFGAALAAIETPTYRTASVVVEPCVRDWSEVPAGRKPWLGYAPSAEGPSSLDYEPFGTLKVTLPISLVGHVAETEASARRTALADLEDDVIAALNVDATLGGSCAYLTLRSTATDEADPEDHQTSRGGTGTLVQTWDAVYFRDVRTTQ